MKYFPEFKNNGDYYLKFLFDYSSENFFYHYISVLDIILNLLNTYYKFDVSGNEINRNFSPRETLFKIKAKNSDLHNILSDFHKKSKAINSIRNDLAHNFSFNEIDIRSKKEVINRHEIISTGLGKYTTSEEVLNNMEPAIEQLAQFLREIKKNL